MVQRQLEQAQGMIAAGTIAAVRQYSNSQILKRLARNRSCELRFTERRLDGHLGYGDCAEFKNISCFLQSRPAEPLRPLRPRKSDLRCQEAGARRPDSRPELEIFYLIRTPWLPPVRVEHLDRALQCAERPLPASGLVGAHDIDHVHAPATDAQPLSILECLNQLWQFILGIGDADFHGYVLATGDSYLNPKGLRRTEN